MNSKEIRENQLRELREQVKEKFAPLSTLFSSELGNRALLLLEEEFCNKTTFVAGDPYYSAIKEGERRAIMFIREIAEGDYDG